MHSKIKEEKRRDTARARSTRNPTTEPSAYLQQSFFKKSYPGSDEIDYAEYSAKRLRTAIRSQQLQSTEAAKMVGFIPISYQQFNQVYSVYHQWSTRKLDQSVRARKLTSPPLPGRQRSNFIDALEDADREPQFDHFLNLPAEIRNMIYAFTFPGDYECGLRHSKRWRCTACRREIGAKPPALLSVSRQVRQEALAVYYKQEIFVLGIQRTDFTNPTPSSTQSLEQSIRRIEQWADVVGPENVATIRRFVFADSKDYYFGHGYEISVRMSRNLGTGCDVRLAVKRSLKTIRMAKFLEDIRSSIQKRLEQIIRERDFKKLTVDDLVAGAELYTGKDHAADS